MSYLSFFKKFCPSGPHPLFFSYLPWSSQTKILVPPCVVHAFVTMDLFYMFVFACVYVCFVYAHRECFAIKD